VRFREIVSRFAIAKFLAGLGDDHELLTPRAEKFSQPLFRTCRTPAQCRAG
jgi:hypothetical protein